MNRRFHQSNSTVQRLVSMLLGSVVLFHVAGAIPAVADEAATLTENRVAAEENGAGATPLLHEGQLDDAAVLSVEPASSVGWEKHTRDGGVCGAAGEEYGHATEGVLCSSPAGEVSAKEPAPAGASSTVYGIGLYPSQDTTISEAEWSKPKGAEPYLYVRSYPGAAARVLIQFDLSKIPADAKIQTATLRLYKHQTDFNSPGRPPRNYSVHRILEPWEESTITWGRSYGEPVIRYKSTPISTTAVKYIVSAGPQPEQWDVTEDLAFRTNHYGWMIKDTLDNNPDANNKTDFFSKENSSPYRALLEIHYTMPVNPPAPRPSCPAGSTTVQFNRESLSQGFTPPQLTVAGFQLTPQASVVHKPTDVSLQVVATTVNTQPRTTLDFRWNHVFIDPNPSITDDEYWTSTSPDDLVWEPMAGQRIRVFSGWAKQMAFGSDEWQFCVQTSSIQPPVPPAPPAPRTVVVESVWTTDYNFVPKTVFRPNELMRLVGRVHVASVPVRVCFVFDLQKGNNWLPRAYGCFDLTQAGYYRVSLLTTPARLGANWGTNVWRLNAFYAGGESSRQGSFTVVP